VVRRENKCTCVGQFRKKLVKIKTWRTLYFLKVRIGESVLSQFKYSHFLLGRPIEPSRINRSAFAKCEPPQNIRKAHLIKHQDHRPNATKDQPQNGPPNNTTHPAPVSNAKKETLPVHEEIFQSSRRRTIVEFEIGRSRRRNRPAPRSARDDVADAVSSFGGRQQRLPVLRFGRCPRYRQRDVSNLTTTSTSARRRRRRRTNVPDNNNEPVRRRARSRGVAAKEKTKADLPRASSFPRALFPHRHSRHYDYRRDGGAERGDCSCCAP